RRDAAFLLGVCASAGGLAGSWTALMAGAVALAAADRIAGPLTGTMSGRAYSGTERSESAMATNMRLIRRAIGWRFLAPLTTSMLPLAGCAILLANNPLDGASAARAARLSGGLSITLLLAGAADMVAFRRPAWPWLRSLPLSARDRVIHDGLALGT